MLESVNDKDINARLECCLVGRTMRTCLLAQDQSCPNCGKKGKQLALILHDTRRQEFGSRCLCNVKNERRRRTSPLYHGDCFSVLHWLYYFLILWLAVLPSFSEFFGSNAFLNPVAGCRPGRHPGYPRLEPRKIVPMTFRQHVPNVSEKTIGASGPTEGKITRDSKRFREELITNLNPNIVFKDEEQTNADRMMTERCRDRLNRLAMMVSEYWKNQVKLRVTEAWDEDGGQREGHSLHYEGRAVDITTTDRDRSKYGMLARLAVEAGFDWVHYESKSHIHCSVKADKSDAARYGGCFSGDSYVFRPSGERIKMSELSVGDEVLSVQTDGRVVRDRVLTFMDRKPSAGVGGSRSFPFKRITTDSGRIITLTSNHLIKTLSARDVKFFYPNTDTSGTYLRARFTYARSVRVGDYIFETRTQRNITELIGVNLRLSRVTSVQEISSDHGAYAPLTARGTILTNGVWTSCYAVLENHDVAHFVMSPMRYFYTIYHWFSEKTGSLPDISLREGVSWYPRFLYYAGSIILPESFLYV